MYQAWIITKDELQELTAKHFNAPCKRGVYFTDFSVSNIDVFDSSDDFGNLDYFHYCLAEDGMIPSEEIPAVVSQLVKDGVLPNGKYLVKW